MGSGKFTPKEETMMGLLMHRVRYSIPRFQREYAWKDEKVDAYWNDMINNYQKAKLEPGNPDNQYYFGGMVILNEPGEEKLILVDGQQRMATTTIFLCLARDWLMQIASDKNSSESLKSTANGNKTRIENYIQIENPDGSVADYKLELNERNKNFFRLLVLTPGIPDEKIASFAKTQNASEKNIFFCYETLHKHLKDYLKSIPETKIPQTLLELINLTLEWVSVISITVKKEEDAFDIFETLNQRGQSLALGDLVKNNLLKHTSITKRDHIDNNWGDMMTNLGDDPNIDQFLRYSWFSRNFFKDGKLIKSQLFKVIKKNVNDDKKVERYVDELLVDSEIYGAITNSSKFSEFWKDDKEIIRNLTALQDLDSLYVIPTIITAYRMHNSNLTTLREIIRLVLVYFFRFKIIGNGHASEVESTMVNMCQNISGYDDEGKPHGYTIDEIRTKLESKVQNDVTFAKQFSNIEIKKTAYVKYILKEIEEVLAGTRKDELETVEKLTLEHVIPKNFKKWQKFFDEKKIKNPETLLYRLGNMTILTKKMNSSISDSIFEEKLNTYKDSLLELNKQTVCNNAEWTDVVIDTRQSLFAENALKIWKF